MADDIDALPKGAGVWGQTIAALVLLPAIGVGLWAYGETWNTAGTGSERRPAACPSGNGEKPPSPPTAGETVRLTGKQLCEALNRTDLAQLLGTPGEIAHSASGSDGSLKLGGGSVRDIATPMSQVDFETYTVTLSASYDRLPVEGSDAGLLWDGARSRTVLGRPAVLSTQSTVAISFSGDGGDAYSGTGVPARVLSVAKDAKDTGGSFELAMWREDGTVPDDAVLLRVAERVLPAIPGW